MISTKTLIFNISIIFLIVFIAVLFYIFSFILAFGGGFYFFPNPPSPEIKHGEFPFHLEYEIKGRKFEYEDILICDFAGYSVNEASGKQRKWKYRMASGNKRITLLITDDIEIFYTPAINDNAAAFYMGDNEKVSGITLPFPNAWHTKSFNSKKENAYIISADEMWEKYGLVLISWEMAKPISNTFK